MVARYSVLNMPRQPIPHLWLLSDERNDAMLERALAKLPAGSGFVFRHYHLSETARSRRFAELAALARAAGHIVILSGEVRLAKEWGADGIYGPPDRLSEQTELIRLATAHDAYEIALANAAKVDAIFLSPVFPTRSHEGDSCLGIAQFHQLARQAHMPVIGLGGMNAARAQQLDWPRWGAIDGLS